MTIIGVMAFEKSEYEKEYVVKSLEKIVFAMEIYKAYFLSRSLL